MKASYGNDTGKGPGYGFLRITDAGALAASDDIRFYIKRASDRKCLGQGGWQPAEIFLEPDVLTHDGMDFQLSVGPTVVDNLDAQETYRITLQGTDGTQGTAALQVGGVIYSPLSGGQGIGSIAAPKPVAPPPPAPEPEPVPEPEPESESKPEPAPQPVQQASPESEKSKLPIILLVLLLLVGGGLAAWKMTSGDDEVPAAAESPMQQARAHLNGSADPVMGLDMASRFRLQENGSDAAFLLAEDAAQKGNASAMVITGDFYSPADNNPHGSIDKDPLEAFSWYSKAKDAGAAEAGARLKDLRSWAEAEVAKGSEQARALLAKFGD